ncbi:hypothetical protein NIIDMKKI_60380 [Mycobacterium kansasii]|uniref:Uncharacterized protein n=1 Tax=Mycobacterium kansasii TaxID=1768 RepID=A0A1V3XYS0_MYCKA|nr:hypothetical protein BZL30_7657 [Mycobacterium kansasii]OOK84198.1 hypothetical protein BZL29_0260 [Mycobacterium kansasii]BCI90832.1 hypothetical protein NIIDMKKI_60380 [Mycobacterium kansasii]
MATAAGFSVQGDIHATVAAGGVEELGRSGAALGESGIGYAAGDAVAACAYGISGGLA